MKPKFRNRLLRIALPTLIVIPTMSHAAVFTGTNGNIVATSTSDGANTLQGNGGGIVLPPYTITNSGSLTGDPGYTSVVNITAPGYTVTNNGNLTGTNHHGILSTQELTLHNYGVISGATSSKRGVQTLGGTTIINNYSGATITAWCNGVMFTTDGGTVVNSGQINSTYGHSAAGIRGLNDVNVTNNGNVTGVTYGVYVGDDLYLTNNFGATISGGTRAGILAGNTNSGNVTLLTTPSLSPEINNYGNITSNLDRGIDVGDGVTIHNIDTLVTQGVTEAENIYAGGIIRGGITCEEEGALGIVSEDGIHAGDDLTLTNDTHSEITGYSNGVYAGCDLDLTNDGTITGDEEDGVSAGDGSFIVNNGTITGFNDGVGIRQEDHGSGMDGNTTSTIINHGSIYSGNYGIAGNDFVQVVTNDGYIDGSVEDSLYLAGGNDIANFDLGSVIDGQIDMGSGEDTINFRIGQIDPLGKTNIVNGDISHVETINKTGSGAAFVGDVANPRYVSADEIDVTGGALYINGHVRGNQKYSPTQIYVYGGEIGGTGDWFADIDLDSNAFISAGSKPIDVAVNGNHSVGLLHIEGDVRHYGPTGASGPFVPSYILENIIPQTPIIDGVNSDLIVHGAIGEAKVLVAPTGPTGGTGAGYTYDLTGAKVLLSPTNTEQAITDGKYKIIDSDEPLAGFALMDKVVGVYANGEILTDTVLGNYFSTLGTEDLTIGSSGGFVSAISESVISAVAPPIGDSNLTVTVEHNYAGLPGLTDNESALGGAIDNSVNNPDPDVQEFIAALDLADLGDVQDTLTALNPEVNMSQAAAIINSDYRLHRMTQEHLAAIRGGSTVTYTAPAAPSAKGEAVAAPSVTTTSSNANAWGAFSMDWQNYSAEQSVDDFDGDAFAFTAGFDWRIAPNLVLGVVLDGSSGSYDGRHSSNSDIDSFRGAIYGTWGESMGLYSDFLVGFGTHNMDLKRDLAGLLAGFDTNDSTDAASFQALWTIGYTMGDAAIKHGPWVGLEYQNVGVDGFKQSGPLPVSVDDYDVDSFRGLIGYRVNGNFDKFRPYAMVAYAQEFEDDGTTTTAKFGSAKFHVKGAELSSAILLSIGTGYAVTENLTFDIGYRGELSVGGSGMDSNGGSIGVNYSF